MSVEPAPPRDGARSGDPPPRALQVEELTIVSQSGTAPGPEVARRRPSRSLLWVFSSVAVGAGLSLAWSDAGSPGFAFGLGVGMVIAATACLLWLAVDAFRPSESNEQATRNPGRGTEDPRPFPRSGAAPSSAPREQPAERLAADLGAASRHLTTAEQEARRAYALLGLAPNASLPEIRSAYHRLAHRYHPDKTAAETDGARAQAERRMKELNAAYLLLRQRRRDRESAPPRG